MNSIQPAMQPSAKSVASAGPAPDPVELRFRNLSYSVAATGRRSCHPFRPPAPAKEILAGVTGAFRPGRLTAVMGASGAGKTSLLQVLAGRARGGTVRGEVEVNGAPASARALRGMSAFVFQDDVIMPTMTVREALTMAATLRLPAHTNPEERRAKLDETLAVLRLEGAADTPVGDSEARGISGGERKRLAIGMELLANPPLLLLDECTSGLDAFTANKVIEVLRDLARRGHTVVCTIHQPAWETFSLFDDLLLLARGGMVYHGPAQGAVAHFEQAGYPIPLHTNPIDYIFLSVLSDYASTPYPAGIPPPPGTPAGALEAPSSRIPRLLAMWPSSPAHKALIASLAYPPASTAKPAAVSASRGFFVQLGYLAGRSWRNALRDVHMVRAKLAEGLVLALFIGLGFLNVPGMDPASQAQSYAGSLFYITMIQVLTNTVSVLNVFSGERAVVRREIGAGYYGLPAMYCSKLAVELPVCALVAALKTTVEFFLIGFPYTPANVAVSIGLNALGSACGLLIGILISSNVHTVNLALGLAPVLLTPLWLFSGLYIPVADIRPYFSWIQYVSPIRWAYEGMAKQLVPQLAAGMGFADGFTPGFCAAMLAAIAGGLAVLAYACLWRVTAMGEKMARWEAAEGAEGAEWEGFEVAVPEKDAAQKV
ncbi:P-loop containing nucleoside triphosphate hydrolase protein [Hyaloraphidium curvatum]|nr:P-loop containing nucleoside triphosphate hydrolase protein [Hyaloraphidium curvatum]